MTKKFNTGNFRISLRSRRKEEITIGKGQRKGGGNEKRKRPESSRK